MHPARRPARAAMRALLWLAAFMPVATVQAADFRLENRVFEAGFVKITVREAQVRGSDVDRAGFERLIDPLANEPFAARAARLNAARIDIPEIAFELNLFGQAAAWRYRDVTLTDLRAGRIARFSAREGDGRGGDPQTGEQISRMRDLKGEAFDITAFAEAVTTTRPAGAPPSLKTVIGRIGVASVVQSQGTSLTLSQGQTEWRGFQLSPGTRPLADRIRLIGEMAARSQEAERRGERAPKPDLGAMAEMLDIWEDIRFGSSTIEDTRLSFKQDRAAGIESDGELTIRRVSVADTGDVSANLIALEGFSGVFGASRISFSRLSMEGFSFLDALKALRADILAGRADPTGEQLANYIPRIGRIALSGLDMEIVEDKPRRRNAAPPAPMRIGIGEMEMAVRAQENGWPTDLRIAIERLSAPVDAADAKSRPLVEMGYTQIEMGSRIDLAWDRTRNEITLREFGLDGRDMLKFTLGGAIGNAGKDLFSNDMALAQVAALGLTVMNLEARLDNSGLFDRLLESEARKARKEPAALRRDWGAMAAIMLPAILGDSPAAKALAGAASRFIAKPGTLELKASASPPGIGLADVIAVADPKGLLGRIDLKADAR